MAMHETGSTETDNERGSDEIIPSSITQTVLGEDVVVAEDDEELYLNTGRVFKIQNLEHARLLKRLSLVAQEISTIEGIDNNLDLEHIDLYQNRITKISGLNHLSKLRYLDLSFNQLREIQNIEHLASLTELYLASNKISEIKNLETLQELRILELGSNRITTASMGLEKLVKLEELWLGKNRITNLDLPFLPNVTKLSLQSNRIQDWLLEFFDRFPNLEELYLSHNGFTFVPPEIKKLKNLRVLDLAGNKVSTLKEVSSCEQLEELWLNDNEVSSQEELQHLAKLRKLNTIYLERNPIQQTLGPGYRTAIAAVNPGIGQVDAVRLTPTAHCIRSNCSPSTRSLLKSRRD